MGKSSRATGYMQICALFCAEENGTTPSSQEHRKNANVIGITHLGMDCSPEHKQEWSNVIADITLALRSNSADISIYT